MTRHLDRFNLVGQIGLLIVLLLLWQAAAAAGLINPIAASSPGAILRELWQWLVDGTLLANVGGTLALVSAGYVAGLMVGCAIGILNGLSPTVRAYLDPFLVFGNSLPRMILMPFFVTWLGFGFLPKVIVVFLVLVFLVAATIEHGMRQISGDIIAHTRMVGAGPYGLLRDVYLPGIGLWVLVSARACVGYALQAAIVAEFFGANRGLGFLIMRGQGEYDVTTVYTALLATVLVAMVVSFALGRIERRATRWLPATS